MNDTKDPLRFLTVKQAAYYLGLSPRTIYNGIAPKSKKPLNIKCKRQGKKIVFERKDLDEYADSIPYS